VARDIGAAGASDMQHTEPLSILLLIPLLTAVAIGVAPARLARTIALVGAVLTFVCSLPLLGLVGQAPGTGFADETNVAWLTNLHVRYHLGVDGVAALLVLLTTFLQIFAVGYSQETVTTRVKEYYIALTIMEGALIGAFTSLDLILFYVFFELSLIPVFLLIGIWGGRRRGPAAVKFFVYTVIGSLLMLAAILYLGLQAGSFDLSAVESHFASAGALAPDVEILLFLGFAIAFAIKTPIFPFHTWLPDAYAESPIACTVMLSGAMAKLGTYGFYRFCFALFPNASFQLAPAFIALAVIGIVYGAWIAAVQQDVKRVIAYSSVSHLSFVVLGLFSFTAPGQIVPQALQGALLQNINHGISTGALFLLVGMIETRRGTRRIADLGGLWEQMPLFGRIFLIVVLSSIALPLTNGFVGEFLILLGAFQANPIAAAIATTGVIWSAVYMLWMFQRVMYGPVTDPATRRLRDLSGRETALIVPFVLLIFLFGLFPTLISRGLNLNPGTVPPGGAATAQANVGVASAPTQVAGGLR
jgi:NADH-quinone oxidoreductase subunit M